MIWNLCVWLLLLSLGLQSEDSYLLKVTCLLFFVNFLLKYKHFNNLCKEATWICCRFGKFIILLFYFLNSRCWLISSYLFKVAFQVLFFYISQIPIISLSASTKLTLHCCHEAIYYLFKIPFNFVYT